MVAALLDVKGGAGRSRWEVQEGRLRFIAAPRAVVVVSTSLSHYKLCQIVFSKNDGSVFVTFPYFKRTEGIVSRVVIPAGLKPPYTLNLTEHGRTTSHLVKFSHHSSGEALFSQDGKVRTEIRRASFPLTGPIGHLFELHAFWLSGFDLLEPAKAKGGRPYLRFIFEGEPPPGVVISGEWRRKRDIEDNMEPRDGIAGPRASFRRRSTGAEGQMLFLGQPPGWPLRDHLLLIECYRTDIPRGLGDDPLLVFMGGWDPHEVPDARVPIEQTGCLACLYPAASPEELSRKIGSIDFKPAPDNY